ncbi:MAG: ComEA family DNA-binding protein [Clostridium sp.]|uniref:ComEA family DNA-binding protein n=1 Tax=Clostridium sp. TaxID=1506 RepID=UPI00302E9218
MKIREKIIGSVTILILSIVFLGFGYFSSKEKNEDYQEIFAESNVDGNEDKAVDEEKQNSEVKSIIVVDIKGAVKNPKEYKLDSGARVRELIQAAGGLTDDADEGRIYFSKLLEDQQCIKIYRVGEEGGEAVEVETDGVATASGGINSKGKININKATLTELQTLYGIGEVKAQSIIDYREANGKFNSVDDLANITGIGAKTVEKLRDKVDIK